MKTARQIVWELLLKQEKSGSYSNLALDAALTQNALEKRDKAFASALFYGVLERKITLDAAIAEYSKLPLSRLDIETHCLLRMGVYQLVYLDSVPDSAAVDESVKLAGRMRNKGAKGFVNAVLRSFIRNGKQISALEEQGNPVQALSVRYSCPAWLVEKWIGEYGRERAEGILSSSLGRPPVTIRVNTLKITSEELLARLNEEQVPAALHPLVPDCICIEKSGDIEAIPSYQEGLFHVQDAASQICSLALGAKPSERVFDLCAAPGGKSFTIALSMQNKGTLYSFDLHQNRVRLIEQGAKRLGLSAITAGQADAAVYHPTLGLADRVLCDVPCSGLGVIRRKPEIKYKSPESLMRLPEIQQRILSNASRYVKAGGTLLYSTCALSREENEENVFRFLEQHTDFIPGRFSENCRRILQTEEHQITLFPNDWDTDGFFIAVFQKKI